MDDVSCVGEPLDEEPRQFRLECTVHGDLVQRVTFALPGGPEMVLVGRDTDRPTAMVDNRCALLSPLAELTELSQVQLERPRRAQPELTWGGGGALCERVCKGPPLCSTC